jgi:tRNA(fMet)-specific endonuclease VapC
MSGNSAALDTNVAIAINNNQAPAVAWVASLDRVFLPVPVLAELLFGAINSRDEMTNRARVASLENRCIVLDTDRRTAETYATLRLALRKLGRPIPENDLWIASLCLQHAVPLCTLDDHFRGVPGLTVTRP